MTANVFGCGRVMGTRQQFRRRCLLLPPHEDSQMPSLVPVRRESRLLSSDRTAGRWLTIALTLESRWKGISEWTTHKADTDAHLDPVLRDATEDDPA